MTNLSELLEPIASQFRSMGIPEPIVHWGHPGMMAIVIFVMGSFVGLAGWRGSNDNGYGSIDEKSNRSS